jgi:serine/threonine-protein kinase
MEVECPKCNFDNPKDSRYCNKCATPLPSSEDISAVPTKALKTPIKELTRGTTFASRYEIIEKLGKGGMGKVYRVEDKKIKEEVALKLIEPEIASDKKAIKRFSNELKMARKIAHRNVCKMYDLGEEKGTHYITMEFVPGEDLKSFIRRSGQLTVAKSISIAKQVCEGLSEAHNLGVVHRDLKPSNIMIDKEGNARIMDFGIARSLQAKGITRAGVMIGTPEYMSPEQVDGKEADQCSDIYSLGVVMYEMITGKLPFKGDSTLSIALKHKSEKPQDPREINPQIPENISRLIMRCLEKDREMRYQTAEELLSELGKIEEGIPTEERVIPKRRPTTSRDITVTFNLKKILIPTLAVVVLAVIAVLIFKPFPKKEVVPAPSDKPSVF